MSTPDPQHWTWHADPVPAGPSVVVDLDGVLADATGRQHFLDGPTPDWRGFFDACGDDPVVDEVRVLLEVLDPGLMVVLLTARPERVRPPTEAWLRREAIRWDLLVMRPRHHYGTSRAFKATTLEELRDRGFELRLGIEDDRRNVEMFRDAGVPCVYLHSGYYD